MILDYLMYFAWFVAMVGAVVVFQLWQVRQIARETPSRAETSKTG